MKVDSTIKLVSYPAAGTMSVANAQAFIKGLERGTCPVKTVTHHKGELMEPDVQVYPDMLAALREWTIVATNHETLPGDHVAIWQFLSIWEPMNGYAEEQRKTQWEQDLARMRDVAEQPAF